MKSLFPKRLSFKSFNGYTSNILYNKYILYFFLTISLVDLFYLTSTEDYTSVSVFVISAFLISFFNKNMIVILFIALVITHILKSGTKIAYEGMTNPPTTDNESFTDDSGISMNEFENNLKNDNNVADEDTASAIAGGNPSLNIQSAGSKAKPEIDGPVSASASKKADTLSKKSGNDKASDKKNDKKKDEKKTKAHDMKEVNKDMKEFYDLQQKIMKGLEDIDPLLSKAENFVEKMQNRE